MFPHVFNGDEVTIVLPKSGKVTVGKSHKAYAPFMKALRERRWQDLEGIYKQETVQVIHRGTDARLDLKAKTFTHNGFVFNSEQSPLLKDVVKLATAGYDVTALVNLFTNIVDSNNNEVFRTLYGSILQSKLTVNVDGTFTAYIVGNTKDEDSNAQTRDFSRDLSLKVNTVIKLAPCLLNEYTGAVGFAVSGSDGVADIVSDNIGYREIWEVEIDPKNVYHIAGRKIMAHQVKVISHIPNFWERNPLPSILQKQNKWDNDDRASVKLDDKAAKKVIAADQLLMMRVDRTTDQNTVDAINAMVRQRMWRTLETDLPKYKVSIYNLTLIYNHLVIMMGKPKLVISPKTIWSTGNGKHRILNILLHPYFDNRPVRGK